MKLKIAIIIFLLLLPTASATVTREFTWNGEKYTESFSIPYTSADRNVTITLSPSPFSDYDIPGYYITESLPSGITLYNTNADWSDLTDRTLSLLRFMPPSDKPSITYTIRLDKEKKYDFFGTYKDENKFSGDIPTQTITVESKPIINFSSIWEPDKKQSVPIITSSEIDDSFSIVPITASQKSPSEDMIIPIISILLIINIILGYLIYMKYYAKKPSTINMVTITNFIRKLLELPPKQQITPQKPSVTFEIIGDDEEDETFEIIGDDDLSEAEQELRNHDLQKIELLKKIRRMLLEKLKDTGDRKVMAKVTQLDKEIEDIV